MTAIIPRKFYGSSVLLSGQDRSYLRYVRELAEKTDVGRLASPSLLKLIYDAARPNGRSSEVRMSAEIWKEIEQLLDGIDLSVFCTKILGVHHPSWCTNMWSVWLC